MNDPTAGNENDLQVALKLVRNSDIGGARATLGIPDQFTDNEILESMVALDKGMKLFVGQKPIDSLPYLQKALPVILASNNDEGKLIVPVFCQYAEGLTALFQGNAHAAVELLNVSSDSVEKISFFVPDFKIVSYSYKATSLIALARTHMNASDMPAAEKVFGQVRDVHDELLKCLDPDDDSHAMGFTEVYGTRVELVFQFIMMVDLPALDLTMWKRRLDMSRTDQESLRLNVERTPEGRIHSLASQYPLILAALSTLRDSLEIVIHRKRGFTKEEVMALAQVENDIYSVQQITRQLGERGQGILYQLDTLRRLQKNVLVMGKEFTKDFGRFSGFVSLGAYIILIILMYFTISPIGVLHNFGALILALIVGFGYGALRFRPLLQLFSDAINKQREED